MVKRLGSNPLDFLKIEGKEDLDYLEPRKPAKIATKMEKKRSEVCIHLKGDGGNYFCESPMARQHGFLGNREGAGQKCRKCHAKILK